MLASREPVTEEGTDMPDIDIEAAILAELSRLSGASCVPVRWAAIRCRVPGTFWAQVQALVRLVETGRVHHVKVGGTPYVWPADDIEVRLRARSA